MDAGKFMKNALSSLSLDLADMQGYFAMTALRTRS